VKNNADNIFTITHNGKDYNYLLLDTVDTADKARFMAMAVETYGMDYAYEDLNSDGFKALLPPVIADNIDYTVWHETSHNGWVYGNFGLYGIGVPTVRVLLDYKDIIGVEAYNINDATKTNVVFGTQTGSKSMQSGSHTVRLGVNSEGVVEVDYLCDAYGHTNDTETRPFFYLDKDFFTKAKIDLNKMGSNVLEMLSSYYTVEDLIAAGYSAEEINIYFGDVEMAIDDLSIYGDYTLGSKLTALVSSEYSDYATVKWMISDEESGTYIEEERGESITLDMNYNAKYLKLVAVLPNGVTAETIPVYVNFLNEEFTGTLTDLTVRGIMSAGNTLSLAYTSENVTDENIIQYKWYKSDAADGAYALAGTTNTLQTEASTSTYYYKATIMLENGVTYDAEAVEVSGRSNFAYSNSNDGAALRAMNVQNNSNYVFSVVVGEDEDSQVLYEFLLLDVIPESDNARYKVLATQTYGGDYAIKDLNSDGFKALLPEAITNHIDYTVYHDGSTNMWGGYGQETYGISAISVKELLNYQNIIGMGAYNVFDQLQENGYKRFATRTNSHRSDSGGYLVSIMAAGEDDVRVYDRDYQCDNHLNEDSSACENCVRCDSFSHANSCNTEIRPFFYLDKDFFNEESVDITDTIQSMISDT